MKKIIVLIILLADLVGNAQCPTPSNLELTALNVQDVLLNWTENGTANTWDIAVVPDFYVGAPLPSNGWITEASNPLTYTALPPGCKVFFVRSVCSSSENSSWIAAASTECPIDIHNYLVSLSNDNFIIENNDLQLFPNPSKNIIQLKTNNKVDKVKVFDSSGKEVLIQTQNNFKINVENLSKGVYLIVMFTENGKFYRKFIKD